MAESSESGEIASAHYRVANPRPLSPRLTIAIPTVNRALLVGRAIESALAQTSPGVEILVSDNGSTDGTQAVISRYASRDPSQDAAGNLRTFRHSTTIPAAQHGRFLMEQAKGEFFVGLSDDDYLEPDFASEVLSLYDEHPELSFVYTGCAVHYEDFQVPSLVGPRIESGQAFLAAHYAGKRELSWCACVTRVRDLIELGPQPDDRIIGDMFFWTKLAFRGPVGCVPRVLSHYILLRSQNDNMSHGTAPAVWARECQLLADEVLQASRQAGADPEYLSSLRADCRRYVGRSSVNQFVWSRLRGASLAQEWKWIAPCVPYLPSNNKVLARLAAALTLPRETLRSLLLSGAAKLAKARSTKERKDCPNKLPRQLSVK